MEPQVTPVEAPISIRIADFVRLKIEHGDLLPGEPVPTLQELRERWSCSIASARTAIQLLKQQGLISGGRGRAPVVRTPVTRVVRSSERHQLEKDLVMAPEAERQRIGQAEIDMSVKIDELAFGAKYITILADAQMAQTLQIEQGANVLRRTYEVRDPIRKTLRMWSISYLPYALVVSNPALLDETNEPWPGGTQHQLSTVGIEITRITDDVTARMPTTFETAQWDLEEGVPLLEIRRTSIDTTGRIVEVTDADFPADRTELKFVTRLQPTNAGD